MQELMIDIETLDIRSRAVVLSIGAVVWHTKIEADGLLTYDIIDRFYRKPEIDEQFKKGRTVGQSTLLWWQQQNPTAQAEAFDPVRQGCLVSWRDLYEFVRSFNINHFWASPATFDFPILETFAEDLGFNTPWNYNQKYDVRTVVNEASYSAKDHKYSHLVGIPHVPVYDCEAQIDLLTAARNRIARRIMP